MKIVWGRNMFFIKNDIKECRYVNVDKNDVCIWYLIYF